MRWKPGECRDGGANFRILLRTYVHMGCVHVAMHPYVFRLKYHTLFFLVAQQGGSYICIDQPWASLREINRI